ncbi:sugar isomerase domain-containing protein [Candidatus Atribacteria bacterium 1244-E10-H5-B2]|nr:MAG: sugar isomerase domain-containing protein [Candidatus Atribacteria bacterium 1244-E10-H5-B2]
MNIMEQYYVSITNILENIVKKEQQSIEKTAELVASMVEKDRLIHVFGSGAHSIMGVMEVFWRAGGFANVNPLFPAGISLIDSHPNIERTTGLAKSILPYYGVHTGDVLIIINVNGINHITIDTALVAKKMEVQVIAITSRQFSDSVAADIPSRHPSNKNLYELADIVIDVHVPPGDSVLKFEGFKQTIGASSTYAICFAINLVFAKAAEILLKKGINPPIWSSANIEGGDEANKNYLKKYLPYVHHLYPMF